MRLSYNKLGAVAVLFLAATLAVYAVPAFEAVPPSNGAREYTPLELEGRQIYIANGAVYCHSQFVRPQDIPQYAQQDQESVTGDYVYDSPALLGTERTGPDLTLEGLRQPSASWQRAHITDPRQFFAASFMPQFPFLSEHEMEALVAYILSLRPVNAPVAREGLFQYGLKADGTLNFIQANYSANPFNENKYPNEAIPPDSSYGALAFDQKTGVFVGENYAWATNALVETDAQLQTGTNPNYTGPYAGMRLVYEDRDSGIRTTFVFGAILPDGNITVTRSTLGVTDVHYTINRTYPFRILDTDAAVSTTSPTGRTWNVGDSFDILDRKKVAAVGGVGGQWQVSIIDFGFEPATLTIKVGDTVTWTNTGQVAHTATSGDGDTETPSGVWNSGLLDPGESFSFTFTTPGTFDYYCIPHPFMQGQIIVSP